MSVLPEAEKQKLWDRGAEWLKVHRQGFLVGLGTGFLATVCLLVLVAFRCDWVNAVTNYADRGHLIGSYQIRKGQSLEIIGNNLSVWFSHDMISVDHRGQVADTLRVFPMFDFYSPQLAGHRTGRQARFAVGRSLVLEMDRYLVTLRLEKLSVRGADTVATFSVHRMDYPQTTRITP